MNVRITACCISELAKLLIWRVAISLTSSLSCSAANVSVRLLLVMGEADGSVEESGQLGLVAWARGG